MAIISSQIIAIYIEPFSHWLHQLKKKATAPPARLGSYYWMLLEGCRWTRWGVARWRLGWSGDGPGMGKFCGGQVKQTFGISRFIRILMEVAPWNKSHLLLFCCFVFHWTFLVASYQFFLARAYLFWRARAWDKVDKEWNLCSLFLEIFTGQWWPEHTRTLGGRFCFSLHEYHQIILSGIPFGKDTNLIPYNWFLTEFGQFFSSTFRLWTSNCSFCKVRSRARCFRRCLALLVPPNFDAVLSDVLNRGVWFEGKLLIKLG